MKYEKSNYGEVEFEGKEYALTGDADFTSRQLPGNWNMNDVSEGEEYQFEMTAPAFDETGKDYKVTWIFWKVKGEEWLPEDLDYDKVYSVEEI
jgi:hypothetical protein